MAHHALKKQVCLLIKKIKPDEKIHWYCFVRAEIKQKIEVLKKIAVKSRIWVLRPVPSNNSIPRELADISGETIQRIAIIERTTPKTIDNMFAIFIIQFQ